ncbi:hypothetical protein KGF54_003251 [Candida jiufengensis]|uniref:uncharacterized protein n=1 Tax=Candida jiufengensis TaxID=497108 RepID=UPI002224076C|nr:uncharacterized protein KGF54_003251 [Candida jiufengensis]KAI5952384.1 hypothetical protein KGF54_003251 [Candida jiufengensis]
MPSSRSWTEDAMQSAITAYKNGEGSYFSVAGKYGVTKSTLQKRIVLGQKSCKDGHINQQLLTKEQEISICLYIASCDMCNNGLTSSEIREIISRFVKSLGKNHHVGVKYPNKLLKKYPWIKMVKRSPLESGKLNEKSINNSQIEIINELTLPIVESSSFNQSNDTISESPVASLKEILDMLPSEGRQDTARLKRAIIKWDKSLSDKIKEYEMQIKEYEMQNFLTQEKTNQLETKLQEYKRAKSY